LGSEGGAGRALTNAVRASLGAAVAAVLGLAAVGRPVAGIALAAGLLLGAVNGPWIRRSVASSQAFWLASMGRLGVLSLAGVGVGYLLGTDLIWLCVAGLAASQMILATASLWEGLAG